MAGATCSEADRRRLLAVARRLLRNEEDAKDAVQDALLAAYQRRAQFRRESSWSTWVYRIAVNCCLMKLRASRRRQEVPLEDGVGWSSRTGWRARSLDEAAREDSMEIVLHRREMALVVRECIERLPEGYRVVVQMRDLEGFETEQIALRLGTSRNAVKVRLHRARKALRALAPLRGTAAPGAAPGRGAVR